VNALPPDPVQGVKGENSSRMGQCSKDWCQKLSSFATERPHTVRHTVCKLSIRSTMPYFGDVHSSSSTLSIFEPLVLAPQRLVSSACRLVTSSFPSHLHLLRQESSLPKLSPFPSPSQQLSSSASPQSHPRHPRHRHLHPSSSFPFQHHPYHHHHQQPSSSLAP
jgi:hypothetical protein